MRHARSVRLPERSLTRKKAWTTWRSRPFLFPAGDYDKAPRRQLRFEAYLRYEDADLKAC